MALQEANSIGGVGIAPAITLLGHNYLDHQTGANWTNAMLQDGVDVVNMSIVFSPNSLEQGNYYLSRAIVNGELERDGKGIIYVKSAGNKFKAYRLFNGTYLSCTDANALQVSCDNASHDYINSMTNVIVVASANADGERAVYSSAGPNIRITGFGGNYGKNLAQTGRTSSFNKPVVVTTDMAGCAAGYSRTLTSSATTNDGLISDRSKLIRSAFNFGFANQASDAQSNAENRQCDYTNVSNGTSSAAASISGVAALLLQANPNLKWREVKDILARTACMPNHSRTMQGGFILNHGVVTNAAGYEFDNWYGFGITYQRA